MKGKASMNKITEIIPDSIPDWAKDAMDDGQFFRMTLERIASLEAQLKEREDERNKALRLLWNCSAKLESQVMRYPNLPNSYYTTMKEGFDYILEINAPPVTGSNDNG